MRQTRRDRRIARLIEHAYRRVPYYRELMQAHGLTPDDIRTVADLQRFPISQKSDLKSTSQERLLAEGLKSGKLVHHRTSGSTGQPLDIRRTWVEERRYGAYRWGVLARYGWRPWLRHIEIEELQPADNGDHRLAHRLAQATGLFRQRRIQALQEPADIVRELLAWPAQAVSGYTGVIARVARHALENNIALPRPRFVGCHSDALTVGIRRQISQAFQAPVFEIYDAYESNVIAWQSPHSSLLQTADACCVVEVIRDGRAAGPGETGKVVITALYSRAMPFIRFAIGDLVRLADHDAGEQLHGRLSVVEGRTVEYFALPDGRMVHPYEVYACIKDPTWISQYQLIQESPKTFELRLVCASPPSTERLESTRSAIEAFLGEGAELSLTPCDRIAPSESGKTPAFRSLVVSP